MKCDGKLQLVSSIFLFDPISSDTGGAFVVLTFSVVQTGFEFCLQENFWMLKNAVFNFGVRKILGFAW